MTVLRVAAIDSFSGLSTDAKPTGVRPGSRFIERDTGRTFITDDGTNWGLIDSTGGQVVFTPADATRTRPNNATPYASGVSLGDGAACLFKFSNFLRNNGGSGFLTGMRFVASVSGIGVTNMPPIRARFYNTSPASAPAADQAAFPSLVSNSAITLGSVLFTTWNIGGSGSDMIWAAGFPETSPMQLVAAAAARDLYVLCESVGIATPAANTIMQLLMSAALD